MAAAPADAATELLARYARGRSIADLKEAISLLEQALEVTPPGTDAYVAVLSNLGAALEAAFSHSHDVVDLERAIGFLQQALEATPPDTSAYATLLNNLATGLSELGRRDDAVAASQEAVDIRRRLAEASPGAYLPDLAMSLNNLGIVLSGVGRFKAARTATEEAVQLYRRLAAADPAAHEPSLARALSNLGNRMSDAGRADEALAATGEAVQLYRRLAAADPATYEPSLAIATANLRALSGGEPQGAPAARRMPRPATVRDDDPDLAAVAAELRALDGDGSRMAAAIRGALDMLLDGLHTGRYRWDQLHKTEKTHAGTLVEIALARSLRLADGATLDYTIAGVEVDCKFSRRLGGWMIPPEAGGKLLLLVQASDEDGTWSAGLVRATEENLRPAGNQDGKRALSDRGRAAVRWLHAGARLQENALLRLPEADVAAIFASASGQQRVNELFRRAQGMRVSRTVVATVAMQDDYMKRVRGGGGARDQLRAEGIVIFGDYAGDQVLASALGLPRPGPGEFVSARLAPQSAGDGGYARAIRLAGADWVLATAADPVGPGPVLPR